MKTRNPSDRTTRRSRYAALAGALSLAVAAAGAPSPASAAEAERPAARWIEAANAALLPTGSMTARATVVTDDGFSGKETCTLDMVRLSEPGVTRTLIEVDSPPAGAGTVYQIVARDDEPLERWVWLPAVRRLRHIMGVQRTDPFLGTEFRYEDLGLAMAVERGDGTVRRVEDEAGAEVIEIESRPYHYYSRVVTRIDPGTNLPTRVDFYDRAGELFRQEHFEAVRRIDGEPFPTRITIHDRITGARSVLTFDSVRFGIDVPLERFTASVIRRRLEAAKNPIPAADEPGKEDDGDDG